MIKKGSLLIRGIDASLPPAWIAENATPDCQNIDIYRGEISKRYGYVPLGVALSNQIMAGTEFISGTTKYALRMSTDKVGAWNNSTLVWDDVTGSDLTGTISSPFAMAFPMLSGARICAFTNYADAIRKYTGSGNTADLGGTPPKCKFMLDYEGYLLLAYILDGSTLYPVRIQWCDTGDPETWGSGNAGSVDLISDQFDITGMARFQNYACIHKEQAIYLGYLVPTSQIFRFEIRHLGLGTICNNTIQTLPNGLQMFLSRNGIASFNGTAASLLKGSINEQLKDNLNYSKADLSWSLLRMDLDEYWIGVPYGSQTLPETVFRYNYLTGAVLKNTIANASSAFYYSQGAGTLWSDLETNGTTWPELSDTPWSQLEGQSTNRVPIIGTSGGVVMRETAGIYTDNSTPFTAFHKTKTYESDIPGQMVRWGVGESVAQPSLEIWAKGSGSLKVQYSIDNGQAFTDIGTITLTGDYPADDAPAQLDFDVVASRLTLRFLNDSASETFTIKQYLLTGKVRELR